MNRIFKVIWSKTKHCYIVVSEYAKANTKAVHTGLRTTAAAAAVAAMLLAPVNYNYAWAADTVTVEEADTSTTTQQTQTVYTTDGADKTFATKADAAVQDAGVVKADKKIGENVTALGKGLYDETAARIGADAAQDKVIQQVNENLVQSVNTINKNVADGFTALNTADANEAKARTDADAAEKAAREAGDTTLDTRITKVKEYLENQTSENYVSKTDAAVQDAGVVKADKKIGENVTALGKGLYDETAARIGADKAQDKVIEKVNQNMVDGFNTINTNMANGFAALNQADANEAKARADADAAEKAARIGADKKLAEAVNSGISLSDDNVLQKNTTKVDDGGNVTTERVDVTEMILNKGKDNQITLSDKGVKVGLNSGVMDKDGFYAGGDTADKAKAALKADGSIKGAGGAFTVDADGKVTAASGKIGNVDITSAGAVSGVTDLTASGKVTAGTLTDGKAAISNGNIKTNGGFIQTGGGNINTQGGALRTNGGNINAGSGTITGNKLTDGVASLQNGNLTTTGNINAHDIVATGDISGKAITGTSLNTQGGAISGGAITGTTITGTTGSFGSLTTTGDASVGGTLSSNGLTNTGNATTDTLTVNHNTTVGGDLAVTGDITGKSLNVGTGAVETGTLETTGNATIGGDLTVDKNLTVNGTFDAKTLSSTVDANNYTTINGGKTQSMNLKMDAATSETKASASTFDENGSNTWAKDDDSIGKSTVTADGISQRLSDTGDNPTVYAERTMSQGKDNKYSMVDTVKDGDKTNVASQSATESSDVVTAANGNTSTFRQRVDAILQELKNADGGTLTKVEQTDTAITSQIGDGSAIKSVMNADGIANTATGKSITNDAADIINKGTNSVTNQVGSNKVVVDTTGVKSAYGDNTYTTWNAEGITNSTDGNMTNTVGGNKSETVTGTSTETVTGKKTENYNGGLETTVTGEEKHTVNGSQTNAITGNQTNTIGGSQTTTVTGDSSLTAENINNTAKNKITNKALDVETDAASSIVSKVSNDYGSNTSTQTSNETKEAMSQADGKTASYLRGAAEEKSQLIDGSKKTTIDTIAGQTNTNITDGTNTSNDLQKADQIASSVTDGTNTTVVNQNAKSLASSITDGTKANNTNSTVDKSEQLIKASDTQYSATTKTAIKMKDALVSGSSIIDVIKNLDDAANPSIGSAVTDGTNSTGVTQTAKDITNTAKNGTIANKAKDITNNATENMTNTVGKDLTTTVGGNQTTTVTGDSSLSAKNITNTAEEKLSNSAAEIENSASKSITDKVGANVERTMTTKKISESVKDGAKSNSFSKTVEKDISIVTDGTKTSTLSQLADSVNTSLKNGTQSLNNTKTVTEDVTKVTDENTGAFSSSSQKADAMTNTVKNGSKSNTVTETASTSGQKLVSGNIIDILKDAENGYVNTTVSNSDGSSSTGVKQTYTDITSTAEQGTITNDAKNLVNKAEEKLSNSAAEIENTATNSIKDTVGKSTVTTTTDGTTFENTDHNGAIGDGSITKTTISGNTLKTGEATMDYAEVMKDLRVGGTTTTKDLHVTNNATIDGTLGVTGAANFQDTVTVAKDLSVAGDVTAKSYKVGDKTYIDENGINANNQKITNVAAGTEDSDAANYGQLRKVETRVDGVENRVTNVENRVDKMDSRIDKVGANAAAMANLHPLEFDEDSKWNVAAAVGNYKGETAAAVGAFYRPNEDVMFNLSTTFGNDENMVGGGLSLRLGKGGKREKDKKLKAAIAENNDLRAKVDDLTARMDALLSVINPNMSKEFPDVSENHWAYEAVTRLAGNDIVQGYEDGKFHGERTMTRYEMAELIYNALSRGAKAEKKLVEEFKPELQAMAAQKQAK